jgi:uncharacterized protein
MLLGFLGSFGHCVGMCGPLTTAFSLSRSPDTPPSWGRTLYFHGLLNLGRLISYTLVGAGMGALSSVLVAGGQFAGVGSGLRQTLALVTGGLLIGLGLTQIAPNLKNRWLSSPLRLLGFWHDRLGRAMGTLSFSGDRWVPLSLGLVWGLIPCGFLYTAQLKAVETASLWQGAATMLAFGLGTLPSMVGVGVGATLLSADQRSQLFRLGGWVTLSIGIVTLLRTGEMIDYTGHLSLGLWILLLVARPISRIWPSLLQYRRGLGVGAFLLALAHTGHVLSMGWDLAAIPFLLPQQQIGSWAGLVALAIMLPLALTSSDWMQRYLNKRWQQLHQFGLLAYLCVILHVVLLGSRYLGAMEWTWINRSTAAGLIILSLCLYLIRSRWFWSLLGLEKFYVSPFKGQ